MQKVDIRPGICGLVTRVEAETISDDLIKVTIRSACEAVNNINHVLGDEFDSFEVCLVHPGEDPFTHMPATIIPRTPRVRQFPASSSVLKLKRVWHCLKTSKSHSLMNSEDNLPDKPSPIRKRTK